MILHALTCGGRFLKRRPLVASLLLGTTVIVAMLVATRSWGVPKVTVVNDLDFTVSVVNCENWHNISSGTAARFRPERSCSVYRINGNIRAYLGCLRFTKSAFTLQEPTRVSDMTRNVSQNDCASEDDYYAYSSAPDWYNHLREVLP